MNAKKTLLALALALAGSIAFAGVPTSPTTAAPNSATKTKCIKGEHRDADGKCVANKPKTN